jgi:phosphoribosylformimino-5-aminoimidazole carboxamide ribotide isomerase
MKLIPVIDLMDGNVVTAIRGQRHSYQPSCTLLCSSCEPQAVLTALLQLHGFDTVYIADLNGIRGDGSNIEVIERLQQTHAEITFWVDNGVTDLERLTQIGRPVIGTESLNSFEHLNHLLTSLPSPILSLDFLDDVFNGPKGLEHQSQLWPNEVIVMTLSRVGSASGPDTSKLKLLKKLCPDCLLYAAGGIRDQQDVRLLSSLGINGALISTALHQGAIDSKELDRIVSA